MEVAHPVEPALAGLIEKFAADAGNRIGQRFVGVQKERHRPGQDEGAPGRDIGDGRIRGDPDRADLRGVANMIAAGDGRRAKPAVVHARPHAHANPAKTRQRLHATHDHRRIEEAAVLVETRREIGDRERRAALRGDDGPHDRRVAAVALFARRLLVESDRKIPVVGFLAVDQGAEDRIAVDAGPAHPHDPPAPIEQRRNVAVADDGQIERRRWLHFPRPCANVESHARTRLGLSKSASSRRKYSPATRSPWPPSSCAAANAD